MSTRAKLALAGVLVVLLAAAGVLIVLGASMTSSRAPAATATSSSTPLPSSVPASPSTPSPTRLPQASGSPADALPSAPAGPPTTVPYTDAARVAQEAIVAYANKLTTESEWWSHLQPYLSQQAAEDYARTDPQSVTIHSLNGPPVQAGGVSPYLASVAFDTDAGHWTVELSRRWTDGTWQVDRFVPPPTA